VRDASYRFSNDLRYRPEDHENQCQLTPAYVLDPVRADLGGVIGLDPCTFSDNPVKAERYYCQPADGADEPWDAETIFVSPPYGKVRERWVRRCIEAGFAGSAVILLMPAATDTRIFQDALETATQAVFVRGRVKFGVLRDNRRQAAASHPSALIGWNVSLEACALLGARIRLTRLPGHGRCPGTAGGRARGTRGS